MKNSIIIILVSLCLWKVEINAQSRIGFKIGYSYTDFNGIVNDPYKFGTFGIPMEFAISKKLGLLITPSY